MARLTELFERRVRLRFGGEPEPFVLELPEADRSSPDDSGGALGTALGTRARLRGRVPDGAGPFTFFASRSFREVHLAVEVAGAEDRAGAGDPAGADGSSVAEAPTLIVLEPGEESPALRIDTGARLPFVQVAGRYLRLGFLHIVPRGIDHVMFVLGLFLLSPRLDRLLWQVSAFTLAHTATLAISVLGWFTLSPSVVEPLIALSIAVVAIENLATTEVRARRLALVFGFGLLHGLGFAGVLGELGLPRGRLVTGLLTFNAGVEMGQLTVLAVAFLVFGLWRRRPDYRRIITVPGSVMLAIAGSAWFVGRLFGV